ncbi:MAG TPA: BON domain-containing protein [Bacillota bacterium]|nr:BON domain-containing protein [Bacillota bacterium]
MKTTFSKITLANLGRLGAVALVATAIGLAGCKTSDRTMGQKWNDHQIASSVEKGLKKDITFKYHDVTPIVHNGTVQLTGFVETPEQRLRAAEIAAQTKGARQVINDIMIKATPTGPVTIRDPLAKESGYLLVDTNSPPPRMRNLHDSATQQQQQNTEQNK